MSVAERTALSIYDLDRTITNVPTWTLFLVYAARRVAPWRLVLLPGLPLAALGAALRLYNRGRLKELMHRIMLGRRLAAAQAEAVAECFGAMIVARHIRPGALAQIASDRLADRRIVLATAAHAFIAAPIARRLGIVDIVATEARRDRDGGLTHRLTGPNCHGPAKHAAIVRWLADVEIDRDAADIRFYTDDVSDRPTLAWADEAVAVNAGRSLRQLAEAMGWPSLDWGRPARGADPATRARPLADHFRR